MKDGFYSTEIHSFTKTRQAVIVSEEFLGEGDKVLIIDDFLANGDASLGLNDIVQQAKAATVGIGIVVEKSFQDGRHSILMFLYSQKAKPSTLKDGFLYSLKQDKHSYCL